MRRFSRWQDCQLSILGKLLVKEGFALFKEEVDLRKMRTTAFGKPYIEGARVRFNITHSGTYVVAAFSDVHLALGVDIERLYPLRIKDFECQMTSFEIDELSRADNTLQAFFTYWTQKEAVLKADGDGLRIPLNSFEVRQNIAPLENQNFFLTEVPIKEGYVCHVATDSKVDLDEIEIKKIGLNKLIMQ